MRPFVPSATGPRALRLKRTDFQSLLKMSTSRFLFTNGVVSTSAETPSVTTFLQTQPGAYTTTRTHNNASCLLFWERHLRRLSNSVQILLHLNPRFLFGPRVSRNLKLDIPMSLESMIRHRVCDSMREALPITLKERNEGKELAITALIGGNFEKMCEIGELNEETIGSVLDVYVHMGIYVPPLFGVSQNGARLAVVGRGRDLAEAKYAEWARLRKPLEDLRPCLATELLLSDDGDRILEGSVTNFFVVCLKEDCYATEENVQDNGSYHPYEVKTAPVHDGVLPGVIRQLVIEICSSKGIAVQEVCPSWSKRETWKEAFITNSLRIVQHVELIQVPRTWTSQQSKTWKEVSWEDKQFKGPGMVTAIIQRELMVRAGLEGYPVAQFTARCALEQ
ncbi:hypothetical protein Nepgr_015174 [Nepenthes gracilis]|uniref:Uncharacterized protein n=1 Tax=Nepenthes gracilis TaxID=150966 RepID=A0AAD3XQH8_NEPGR|nr:hypothetical protein Nepgr_015174 [Nepenthes gracilis]